MGFLLHLVNWFSLLSVKLYAVPLAMMFFLGYLFVGATSIFLQLLLITVFYILLGSFLSCLGLDFFSGILLAAEFPIIFVMFLFYFHKNSISFDNLYVVVSSRKRLSFVVLLCMLCVCWCCTNTTFIFWNYSFSFLSSFTDSFRNDFFLYYYIYYVLYPSFVLLFGLLIFVVSFLVILIYFYKRLVNNNQKINKKHFSFLRKQNLLKQAVFNPKLAFFKKQ